MLNVSLYRRYISLYESLLKVSQKLSQIRCDIRQYLRIFVRAYLLIPYASKGFMAEREGFEPPLGYYPKPTFQAGAFDRSAISPIVSRLFIYSLYEISNRSLYTQNISMCQFLYQLELRVIYC